MGAFWPADKTLVPIMAFRSRGPRTSWTSMGWEALKRLVVEGGKLCIGACVRHAAFHKPVVEGPRLGRLLANVVQHIAHYPIRTRGTFCGSVAHADPASEWCLVVAALDGEMVARSTGGTRVIPAREFFQGIMSTALKEDELLTEMRLPLLPADTHCGFYEFNRRAGDFALAMAVATYRVREGVMVEPRVAIGSVGCSRVGWRKRKMRLQDKRPAAPLSRRLPTRWRAPSIRSTTSLPALNIGATSRAP